MKNDPSAALVACGLGIIAIECWLALVNWHAAVVVLLLHIMVNTGRSH